MSDDERSSPSEDSDDSGSSDGVESTEPGVRLSRRDTLRATGGAALGVGIPGVDLGQGAFGGQGLGGGTSARRGGRATQSSEWTQQAKLFIDDSGFASRFGRSVAVDGSTAIVGSGFANPAEGSNNSDAGAAAVFEESGGSWTQQAKLTADDGDRLDRFGDSVAIDGSTAIFGAYRDRDPNGFRAGSAYVFSESGGSWTQQAKLAADDGEDYDLFGSSVAVNGSTAIVGAPGDEDPNGDDAGSAYVFSESGGSWTQQTKLVPDDGDSGDSFGASVAVSGSTAIVGAPGDEDPNGEGAGSAYVFEESGGTWTQQAKLTADDGDSGDSFGSPVAVSGSTAIVGASDDEDPNGEGAGSAYVFSESGGSWTQQAKLAADDGDDNDFFGSSVAIDGSIAIVGAPEDEDPNGDDAGSAYVFEESAGSWTQQAKLAADDRDGNDFFGSSMAVDGSTAIVGANLDDNSEGVDAGSAYVFSGGDSGGGSAPPVSETFQNDKQLKLGPLDSSGPLADRVDNASVISAFDPFRGDVGDRLLAEDTIAALEDAHQRGAISTATAEDAIRRLVIGERGTRSVLETIGPAGPSSLNYARRMARLVLSLVINIGLIAAAAAAAGVNLAAAAVPGTALDLIRGDAIGYVLGSFIPNGEAKDLTVDRVKTEVNDIIEKVESGDVTAAGEVQDLIQTAVDEGLDPLVEKLRAAFEFVPLPITIDPITSAEELESFVSGSSIWAGIVNLHAGLRPADFGNSLSGSTSVADSAVRSGSNIIRGNLDSLADKYDEARSDLGELSVSDAVVDTFQSDNSVPLPVDVIEALLSVFGGLASIFVDLVEVMADALAILITRQLHGEMITSVTTGSDVVGEFATPDISPPSGGGS